MSNGEQEEEITIPENLLMASKSAGELYYLVDTTPTIIWFLQSFGWKFDPKDQLWEKTTNAVVNAEGFKELRGFALRVYHKDNQLSWVTKENAKKHVVSILNSFGDHLAHNIRKFGIKNATTFYAMMNQISGTTDLHFMKSDQGATLRAITQQVNVLMQGKMGEEKKKGVFESMKDKITGGTKRGNA